MNALNQQIKKFYDRSTPIWLDTWGEHMHHGYYGDGNFQKDHRQAQVDLVEQLLDWGGVKSAAQILDAGCGVGGSARLLAQRFGAKRVLGCTLSTVQAERGQQYNRAAGLDQAITIEARDMMTLTPEDGPFDLIWSLESAEHIEEKAKMLQLFYKLLAPGGRLLMATWCQREVPPVLSYKDQRTLQRIAQRYHLPPLVQLSDLRMVMARQGFKNVLGEDWSVQVAPFWKAVINSAINRKSVIGLLRAGWPTIRGAFAMRFMVQGYRKGLIRFAVFQGQKV